VDWRVGLEKLIVWGLKIGIGSANRQFWPGTRGLPAWTRPANTRQAAVGNRKRLENAYLILLTNHEGGHHMLKKASVVLFLHLVLE